jgi:hypothetical protein
MRHTLLAAGSTWGVRELFHHHEPDKQMTEAEREKLRSDGATIQGMVMDNQPSAADSQLSRLRLQVRFKDGQTVEFSEELATLYQPAPDSPEGRRLVEVREAQQLRHPDRIPKIQLPLFAGERVPIRYDAADPRKMVLDLAAVQKRALHDYIKREQRPKGQPPAPQGTRTGPPWVVPAHCPNCGAPVDQPKAARDRDPACQFCHQPLPVTPA